MCGIGGIESELPDTLIKMGRTIAHRGPDFQGEWSNDSFAFTHRLLAIRSEVARSKQPLSEHKQPWVLVFNGQIYNTKEIKQLLPHQYVNEELDTTLLYALIKKYGWSFISYIQGMFAIVVYNTEEKTLRLYRDQSGQKNIYYTHELPTFAFCSEIKGLLETVSIPSVSDSDGIKVAMTLGYLPGDKTIFKHIRKVRPGEVVTYRKNQKLYREFYESQSTYLECYSPEEVITQTIKDHLASRKKVALNLSGGMDSSLLLHEMKVFGHDMHTYTTRFISEDDYLNKDADLALKLSKDYGTDHNEIEITSKIYKDNLMVACETIEEPNYNISLATYLEVAKNEGINGDKNRVILSGDGGDEVFGGYPMYKRSLRYSKLMGTMSPYVFNKLKQIRDGEQWNYANPIERWLRDKYFFLGEKDRKQISLSYLSENLPPQWKSRRKDPVRDMMYLDRYFWLAGENFIRSDKLYMSQSLELRSPLSYEPLRTYFDKRLSHKNYFNGEINKYTLRTLYKDKLPTYITERKDKTGWRSPINVWWDTSYKGLFLDAFRNAPRGEIVQWDVLERELENKDGWPGKYFHLYFSLAVLSKKYNMPL